MRVRICLSECAVAMLKCGLLLLLILGGFRQLLLAIDATPIDGN